MDDSYFREYYASRPITTSGIVLRESETMAFVSHLFNNRFSVADNCFYVTTLEWDKLLTRADVNVYGTPDNIEMYLFGYPVYVQQEPRRIVETSEGKRTIKLGAGNNKPHANCKESPKGSTYCIYCGKPI